MLNRNNFIFVSWVQKLVYTFSFEFKLHRNNGTYLLGFTVKTLNYIII